MSFRALECPERVPVHPWKRPPRRLRMTLTGGPVPRLSRERFHLRPRRSTAARSDDQGARTSCPSSRPQGDRCLPRELGDLTNGLAPACARQLAKNWRITRRPVHRDELLHGCGVVPSPAAPRYYTRWCGCGRYAAGGRRTGGATGGESSPQWELLRVLGRAEAERDPAEGENRWPRSRTAGT